MICIVDVLLIFCSLHSVLIVLCYLHICRCVLVSADYSQIEMRVLAHLCQDSVLLGLFRQAEGYDIYRHLAARIFRKQVADVAEDERTKAKVICLGTVLVLL